MTRFSALAVLPLFLVCCSCAKDSVGRPDIVKRDGSVRYPKKMKRQDQYTGLYAQLRLSEQPVTPGSGKAKPTQQQLEEFRNAGFDVINQACQDYISSKAGQQRTVNVWRDSFAPITALVTGAIPIIDSGDSVKKDVLQALSLTTNAAGSFIDIYEQRFLFGTKNVESVRSLILDALNEHALKAGEVDKNLTYGKAVLRITEHQIICSPSAISNLVTESIKAAKASAEVKNQAPGGAPPGAAVPGAAAGNTDLSAQPITITVKPPTS